MRLLERGAQPGETLPLENRNGTTVEAAGDHNGRPLYSNAPAPFTQEEKERVSFITNGRRRWVATAGELSGEGEKRGHVAEGNAGHANRTARTCAKSADLLKRKRKPLVLSG